MIILKGLLNSLFASLSGPTQTNPVVVTITCEVPGSTQDKPGHTYCWELDGTDTIQIAQADVSPVVVHNIVISNPDTQDATVGVSLNGLFPLIPGVTLKPKEVLYCNEDGTWGILPAELTSLVTVTGTGSSGGVSYTWTPEVPKGSLDGKNSTFTLSYAPAQAGSLFVFRNGVLQEPGEKYSFSGATINFKVPPLSSDFLFVSYVR